MHGLPKPWEWLTGERTGIYWCAVLALVVGGVAVAALVWDLLMGK